MTTNGHFTSAFGPLVSDYLTHMRALGREYAEEERVLRLLDAFLTRTKADLSHSSFSAWCLAEMHLTSGVRRQRMRIVRKFCLYRRRVEPGCFLPDITQFPADHQRIRPHIFTGAEIVGLLKIAGELLPRWNSPLLKEVYRLAIVLLYTTGLRRGELVRLKIGDYEPYEHTLLIRESKFHKSRIVPLSADGVHELETYLNVRHAKGFPMSSETALLWNRHRGGDGYKGACIGMGMRCLFHRAGIRTIAGRLPRTHDLRYVLSLIMFWV